MMNRIHSIAAIAVALVAIAFSGVVSAGEIVQQHATPDEAGFATPDVRHVRQMLAAQAYSDQYKDIFELWPRVNAECKYGYRASCDARDAASVWLKAHRERSPIRQCLTRARDLMDYWTSVASHIAGQDLEIERPDMLVRWSLGDNDAEPFLARIRPVTRAQMALEVHERFCDVSANEQQAIVAHEFGHAIDHVKLGNRGTEYGANRASAPALRGAWGERGVEVRASAYAVKMYQMAGIDPAPIWKLINERTTFDNHYRESVESFLAAPGMQSVVPTTNL